MHFEQAPQVMWTKLAGKWTSFAERCQDLIKIKAIRVKPVSIFIFFTYCRCKCREGQVLGFVKAGFYQVSMTREQRGKDVGSAVSYCAGPRSKYHTLFLFPNSLQSLLHSKLLILAFR